MAVVPIVVTSQMGANLRHNINLFMEWYSSLCEQYPIIRLIVSLGILFLAVELVSKCFKVFFDFFIKE